jgi:hypothetical protein
MARPGEPRREVLADITSTQANRATAGPRKRFKPVSDEGEDEYTPQLDAVNDDEDDDEFSQFKIVDDDIHITRAAKKTVEPPLKKARKGKVIDVPGVEEEKLPDKLVSVFSIIPQSSLTLSTVRADRL